MKYEILFAPQAVEDLKRLSAKNRSTVRDAIEKHLRFEPMKLSRSRIKRLRSLRHPQYRLRIGDFRVLYDVSEVQVEILAIIPKSQAADWLEQVGGL
jgi:mRNA interferase RelE/StbE